VIVENKFLLFLLEKKWLSEQRAERQSDSSNLQNERWLVTRDLPDRSEMPTFDGGFHMVHGQHCSFDFS
jgi:hypothetical protein